MLTASCTYDKDTDSYDVKFNSNWADKETFKTFLALIKASVSASNRTYNPENHHWSFIKSSFDLIVIPLFTAMKVKYIIEDKADKNTVGPENFFYEHAVNQRILETPETLGAQLIKLLGVSEEVLKDTLALKKEYRKKALEWHPDRNGGDGSKMSTLNEVWNAYNKI